MNALLVLIKLFAGIIGHANALVADAIESSGDIFSSMIVWMGLSIAARPADEDHPYGHGKAEHLAALEEACDRHSEALEPLMRRTIENGFEPTGPLVRGDLATIEAHREAVRRVRPELETLYDLLAEATAQ